MINKFGNNWCEHNGVKFQSKAEMNRYIDLENLQRAGEIENLCRQVRYKFEELRLPSGRTPTMVADHRYDITYKGAANSFKGFKVGTIIEDVKGYMNNADPVTKLFFLKCALLKKNYGHNVHIYKKGLKPLYEN